MGKSSPKAPDPYATASAQTMQNIQTARVNARLNRGDTVSPLGTVRARDLGGEWLERRIGEHRKEFDEGGGGKEWWNTNAAGERAFDEQGLRTSLMKENPDADKWETRVELSPEQQKLYDQGIKLSQGTNDIALDMLPEARKALLQPMATDDADARDRATALLMSRMEPQFARDRDALESRLVAQGFTPGSEGYRRAADELMRARTDARMAATTAGLDESRKGAQFANSLRTARIQELGSLFGIGPGAQMPQSVNTAQSGVGDVDLSGAIQSNYQAKSQKAAADNAAGASAAAAAMMAVASMASDERVKEDIEEVGKLDNGLTVYRYRYKGDPRFQIGVMAQDVEKREPDAVGSIFGVKHVDYLQATRKNLGRDG